MAIVPVVLCLALFCVSVTAFTGWLAGVLGQRGEERLPAEFRLFGDVSGVAAAAAWIYQVFVGVPWG